MKTAMAIRDFQASNSQSEETTTKGVSRAARERHDKISFMLNLLVKLVNKLDNDIENKNHNNLTLNSIFLINFHKKIII